MDVLVEVKITENKFTLNHTSIIYNESIKNYYKARGMKTTRVTVLRTL